MNIDKRFFLVLLNMDFRNKVVMAVKRKKQNNCKSIILKKEKICVMDEELLEDRLIAFPNKWKVVERTRT